MKRDASKISFAIVVLVVIELFIVNPYWSVQGTQELSRRLRSSSRALGSATVMTRAKLEAGHRHGLGDFLRLFTDFPLEMWLSRISLVWKLNA